MTAATLTLGLLAQRIATLLGIRIEQVANWQPDQEPPSTRRRPAEAAGAAQPGTGGTQ